MCDVSIEFVVQPLNHVERFEDLGIPYLNGSSGQRWMLLQGQPVASHLQTQEVISQNP